MIREGKRLYRLGFAIHWLKPKSKMPLDAKWTTGDRKKWAALDAQYKEGFNVGVRLGQPTRFEDGTHLAVVDCDVKSESPKHRREMEKKLAQLIPSASQTPQVASGRGNGSCHIYIRTRKPVAKGFRFSQSNDKVKVRMPSIQKWTPFERENLTEKEIKAGWHIRPAWEISVMGTGQQVVLPPSIHPDTGGAYEWQVPVAGFRDIPLIKLTEAEHETVDARVAEDAPPFKAEDVDLLESELPDSTVALILSGDECEDRSAGLFTATIAMVKAGFTDNQILSVLTDRDTYLGQCAYDHTQSASRRRAAEWVRRYTLTKVKADLSAKTAFDGEVIESELGEGEAAKQGLALLGEGVAANSAAAGESWQLKIERAGDHPGAKPKTTLKNVHLILTHAVGSALFKRNEFTMIDHFGMDTPWGAKKGHEVNDRDLVFIKHWLSTHYRFEPSTQVIMEAMIQIAGQNCYHPIRNYLRDLEWDGVARIDRWLETYMNAEGPKPYLRAVGPKTLIAMVARVMRPGCKFDNVLILEGPQGCGKSTAVRILADPWGSDAMISIGDKDAILAMRLAWVMELGELSSMRKADVDQLKQFISQPTDRIRVPYGKLTETFPRQSIFIGTTNSSEYLKDTTGNRRFWPVSVRDCDLEALSRDRDQLLAEAKVAYDLGETIYLPKETEKVAQGEQAGRVFVDEWRYQLSDFLNNPKAEFPKSGFTLTDLFSDFGPWPHTSCDKASQMRAADVCRSLGLSKKRVQRNGVQKMLWTKNDDLHS